MIAVREGIRVGPWGLRDSKVVVVGEAPGADEELKGEPFVGVSGQEMDKMLHESGFIRNECYLTNVCKHRPPDNKIDEWFSTSKKAALEASHTMFMGEWCNEYVQASVQELHEELAALNPNIIICFGATALWAVTGKTGITTWRGSIMDSLPMNGRVFKVLPTYHPANILRQWENRPDAVHDLCRARGDSEYPEIRYPAYNFLIRPSFQAVMETLEELERRANLGGPTPVAVDLETRNGYIACIGLAWSRLDAICIPIMCVERVQGYWTVDEETAIVDRVRKLLLHPNIWVIGQNFGYDTQYTAKEWGVFLQPKYDTMILQHVFLPGKPKGLDYISSMYCEFYQYWKDEGKEWNPKTTPEEQLWVYNCKDGVNTWEACQVLIKLVQDAKLWPQYEFEAYDLWPELVKMMLRGILVNKQTVLDLLMEAAEAVALRHQFFVDVLSHDLNPRSTPQMRALFYGALQCKTVLDKKTKRPTLNDEALEVVGNREPLLFPLVDAINEERTLANTAGVLRAQLDPDGRMRCHYGQIPETFRLNSKKNVLGGGTNLQNISKGDRTPTMKMPNVRRIYIPDPGYIIGEPDLAGADAQVVAWESNDPILKEIFRKRLKLHAENAKLLFGGDAGIDGKREPYYTRAKQGCHAYNYGASAYAVSVTIGISRHEADRFKKRWFEIHPAIRQWHTRTESDLLARREVRNMFGYRRFFFERVQEILPDALAWVPQSTVACIINRGLVALARKFDPDIVQVLLQVHDSLVIQIKQTHYPYILPEIEKALLITLPYPDPLTIPVGLKTSKLSWGDAKDVEWKLAA